MHLVKKNQNKNKRKQHKKKGALGVVKLGKSRLEEQKKHPKPLWKRTITDG